MLFLKNVFFLFLKGLVFFLILFLKGRRVESFSVADGENVTVYEELKQLKRLLLHCSPLPHDSI